MSQLLWLSFWTAMLLSIWQLIAYMDYNRKPLGEHIYQMLIASAAMFIMAGLGALNRRPKTGAVLGVLAALIAVWNMAPWIY